MADSNSIYPGFGFMNPGAAVANTLQEILAAKRAQARQDMLDRMDMADKQSVIDYRSKMGTSLEATRQAQERQRNALAAATYGKILSPDQNLGWTPPGAAPNDLQQDLNQVGLGANIKPQVDPEQAAVVGPKGFSTTGAIPVVGQPFNPEATPSGVTSGASSIYSETPETHPAEWIPTYTQQQEINETRSQQAAQARLNSPEVENMSIPQKANLWKQAYPKGGEPPAAFLQPKPVPEDVPIIGWDRNGKPYDTGMKVPKGSIIRQEPAPEKPEKDTWALGTIPDPDNPDKQKYIQYNVNRPGQFRDLPPGFQKPPTGGGGGSRTPPAGIFGASQQTAYARALNPAISSAQRVALGDTMIDQAPKLDPSMKRLLKNIFHSGKYMSMPFTDMVKDPALGLQGNDPADIKQLEDALSVLRNGYR